MTYVFHGSLDRQQCEDIRVLLRSLNKLLQGQPVIRITVHLSENGGCHFPRILPTRRSTAGACFFKGLNSMTINYLSFFYNQDNGYSCINYTKRRRVLLLSNFVTYISWKKLFALVLVYIECLKSELYSLHLSISFADHFYIKLCQY